MIGKVLGLIAAVAMIAPGAASASMLTWDFVVTLDSGPGAGTTLPGIVSIDSAGLPIGEFIRQIGLVIELDFAFEGQSFDEETANTGYLQFNPDGTVLTMAFGSECRAGVCSVNNPGAWVLLLGSEHAVNTGEDDDFLARSANGELVRGDIEFSLRGPNGSVPEPTSLAILACGLVGVFARRQRTRVA